MSPISEQERRFAEKGAAVANETIERGKAATERSAQAVEQSYTAAVGNMRDFNLKIIDMAQANIATVFELARRLATAKTPADYMELWSTHARKQFEMLTDQGKELTALGQKLAADSAAPIERSVNSTFKKAS